MIKPVLFEEQFQPGIAADVSRNRVRRYMLSTCQLS